MRTGANYSTWWNGGLRTITYFHNMIGILTEIIGNPTPIDVPLVADKQLATGDWPMPVPPQKWRYRQSIEYSITNNRAILDIASRYRETFLYNIYRMGRNSIDNGGRDHWTTTPKRIAELQAAAAKQPDQRAAAPPSRSLPSELYGSVLQDPARRDPRGYIIPSDQADFPTATAFVNTLLKTGITVLRAASPFKVGDKSYPAGSYVVKTAQAFRPHVMDMFEPQDHPNDFRYAGGPPNPPYDIAGWTLAFQMGVAFDRIIEGFDGPFEKVSGLVSPPVASITGPPDPKGYLVSHRINNSYIVMNRLLKAASEVYWLKNPEQAGGLDLGAGAIWVPASPSARGILERGARELGVPVRAVAQAPAGEAWRLKPVRIGLYDQYGGSMTSGWTRWLLEQFEFPFEVVYPQTLDAGDLNGRFDVLVFTDGIARAGAGTQGGGPAGPQPETIPEEYRSRLGRITEATTMPQLKKFVEAGGSLVTIGSSTGMAASLGLPVKSYLTEKGPDGRDRPLPREKFYVPGSLLKARVDNTNPLAYGMPGEVNVFFSGSPVFRLEPNAALERTAAVAWFSGTEVLSSGWAWGQQYLDGGTAVVEASVGQGKVFLLGPEVAFRAQPHATFKLLFNGLYYGSARPASLP
jgi:hypothetical protein